MHTITFKEIIDIKNNKEKGQYIKYENLQMADYLQPEAQLNVTKKIELFAFRTEINFN